jgi:predicted ATPase
MLTRLEVDGFKNLLDLHLELGPFTCIAGENGTGKSNVFDAIQFLSLLADHPLMEAAQAVRSTHGERYGDARDLFWNGYRPGEHRMRFAAEMIVPPGPVEDDFGQLSEPPASSFLRYELELGYQPPAGAEKIGRLVLLYESLDGIAGSDVPTRLRLPHSKPRFREAVVGSTWGAEPFIATQGSQIVVLPGGEHSRRAAGVNASRVKATAISTRATSDHPSILAARREMQSWRRLALEPSALRSPDRYADPRALDSNGLHLPGTLFRIALSGAAGEDPSRVYAGVAGRLSDLSGLQVRAVDVDEDDVRELLTIRLHEIDGTVLPARSLSEGTLRFLALCVLLEDPDARGLVCMEEPENGIHPANLQAMVDLLRDLAVDPHETPGPDNPFRQVLINTHSPGVVQLVRPDDLLFADTAAFKTENGKITRRLRLRPLAGTWRAEDTAEYVTKADILPYLETPPGAQLTLDGGDDA